MDVEIIQLFYRYFADQCSKVELELIFELLQTGQYESEWEEALGQFTAEMIHSQEEASVSADQRRYWQSQLMESIASVLDNETTTATIAPATRATKPFWRFRAAAAVVFLLITVGLLLYRYNNMPPDPTITPGGNSATLTLSDGRVVALSDAQEGIIVGENSISYHDGSAILESRNQSQETSDRHTGSLKSQISNLMSISTPNGGTYTVTLPDGSRVWLNANSTLRYPFKFHEDHRTVELEGEAYFEVRQRTIDNRQQTTDNRQQTRKSVASHLPFKVVSQGQTVEVLGTAFNISTYQQDGQIQTTLVEGVVRVDNPLSAASQLLQPGQQSVVSGAHMQVRTVDIHRFVAWKDNDFVFQDTPIQEVMQMLARWYDVEIKYESDAPVQLEIGGMISRNSDLETVLSMIAETQKVSFSIQRRTIVVGR